MHKQNLHTHSCYDDGKDPIADMVEQAIALGYDSIGFSGHGSNPIDECSMSFQGVQDYKREIAQAQNKYGDQIQIYCGIEQDSKSRLYDPDYAYVIGSVHFVKDDLPVDYSQERFEKILHEEYQDDIRQMCQDYYEEVARQAAWKEVDIIGHVDLISKYNEEQKYFAFEADWYLDLAKAAIDACLKAGKIFEMNTGAISRGYRQTPYPHQSLLKYIQKQGGRIVINADCHNKDRLDCGRNQALKLAKEAGFKSIAHFNGREFVDVSIDEVQGEKYD